MSTAEPKERIPMTSEEREAAFAKIRVMLDEDEVGPEAPSTGEGLRRAWIGLIAFAMAAISTLLFALEVDSVSYAMGLALGVLEGALAAYILGRFFPANQGS